MVARVTGGRGNAPAKKAARPSRQTPTMGQLWAALYLIAEWEEIPVEELYLLVTGLNSDLSAEKALTSFVRSYGRRLCRTERAASRSLH